MNMPMVSRGFASTRKRIFEVLVLLCLIACASYALRFQSDESQKRLVVAPLRACASKNDMRLLERRLSDINAALLVEPENFQYLALKATVLHDLRKFEEEAKVLKALSRREFGEPFQVYLAAMAYYKTGYYNEAIELSRKSIKMSPRTSDGYNLLAYCLAKQGDFKSALSYAEKSVELGPNDPYNLDTLAYVMVGLGRYQEALIVYDAAVDLSPNYPEARRGRAVANRTLGNLEASQKDIDAYPDECLHWTLDTDPGEHAKDDKSLLISPSE